MFKSSVFNKTGDVSETIQCMSKEVNYNQKERLALTNLKYLFLVCYIILALSYTVILLEFAHFQVKRNKK